VQGVVVHEKRMVEIIEREHNRFYEREIKIEVIINPAIKKVQ